MFFISFENIPNNNFIFSFKHLKQIITKNDITGFIIVLMCFASSYPVCRSGCQGCPNTHHKSFQFPRVVSNESVFFGSEFLNGRPVRLNYVWVECLVSINSKVVSIVFVHFRFVDPSWFDELFSFDRRQSACKPNWRLWIICHKCLQFLTCSTSSLYQDEKSERIVYTVSSVECHCSSGSIETACSSCQFTTFHRKI